MVVEGALGIAVSDNKNQGQREKSGQKRHNSKCYVRGLFSISTAQSHIGAWGKMTNQQYCVFI